MDEIFVLFYCPSLRKRVICSHKYEQDKEDVSPGLHRTTFSRRCEFCPDTVGNTCGHCCGTALVVLSRLRGNTCAPQRPLPVRHAMTPNLPNCTMYLKPIRSVTQWVRVKISPIKSLLKVLESTIRLILFSLLKCCAYTYNYSLVCKCADCMTEKQGSKLLFRFVLTIKIRSISFNHIIDHKMSTVRERNAFIFNNSHYKWKKKVKPFRI